MVLLRRTQKLLVILLFLCIAVPAQAHVWRSSTGNIFRFQNNGTYTVLHPNGAARSGNWWWVRPGYKAEYMYGSTRMLVYIDGQTARVYQNDRGNPSYWSYLGSRGGGEVDTTKSNSWFMEIPRFEPQEK